MRIDVHHHFHTAGLPAQIAALPSLIENLAERIIAMSQSLTEVVAALKAEAEANLNAQNAAEEVLKAIPSIIQEAVDRAAQATDVPGAVAMIQEVVDSLKNNTPELAAAIVAGTPADPNAPPAPAPEPEPAPPSA